MVMDLTRARIVAQASSVRLVNVDVRTLHDASLKVTSATMTTTAVTIPTKVAKFAEMNVRTATEPVAVQQGVDVSLNAGSVTVTTTVETCPMKIQRSVLL